MLNIHQLERQWLRYKIKSYIPYIVILLSLILIITALSVFLFPKKSVKKDMHIQTQTTQKRPTESIEHREQNLNETTTKEQTEQQKTKITKDVDTKTQAKPITKKVTLPENTTDNQNMVLQPAMGFLEHLARTTEKKEKIQHKQHKRAQVAPIETPKEEYMNTKVKKQKPSNKISTPNKKVVKNTIIIKRKESQNDIKEVLARFKNNNNPALSLFVAKKYYEMGDYKQAYNYALITNKINNDIEESWLIFAKALVKLGEKPQAIKTLREYIHFSHSSNAQILLDEIQRGKFQ